MDEKQLVLEAWKKKVEGIQSDPPIDYKTVFNETVRKIADIKYSILDIGTGAGRVIFENNLGKIYRKVVGIDIRPEMIELCRERAKGMKNVEFLVTDATKQMPFKPGSFDVVSAMFPPFSPDEVNRVLGSGGYFVLLSSLKGDHKEVARFFPELEKYSSGNYSFTTLKNLSHNLKNSGFKVVSTTAMKYKWVFRDEEALKRWYEKVTFRRIFDGHEDRLASLPRNIDGRIPVTRFLCTMVARKQ
jgi:ubiquinone/menaquinone biosynthesis C-methylase UbiE